MELLAIKSLRLKLLAIKSLAMKLLAIQLFIIIKVFRKDYIRYYNLIVYLS